MFRRATINSHTTGIPFGSNISRGRRIVNSACNFADSLAGENVPRRLTLRRTRFADGDAGSVKITRRTSSSRPIWITDSLIIQTNSGVIAYCVIHWRPTDSDINGHHAFFSTSPYIQSEKLLNLILRLRDERCTTQSLVFYILFAHLYLNFIQKRRFNFVVAE